jgi:hypothetical protein
MYGTYCRLNVHVYASNIEVIRRAYCKLNMSARHDRKARDARHAFYRQMLDYHREARNLVREWRL